MKAVKLWTSRVWTWAALPIDPSSTSEGIGRMNKCILFDWMALNVQSTRKDTYWCQSVRQLQKDYPAEFSVQNTDTHHGIDRSWKRIWRPWNCAVDIKVNYDQGIKVIKWIHISTKFGLNAWLHVCTIVVTSYIMTHVLNKQTNRYRHIFRKMCRFAWSKIVKKKQRFLFSKHFAAQYVDLFHLPQNCLRYQFPSSKYNLYDRHNVTA